MIRKVMVHSRMLMEDVAAKIRILPYDRWYLVSIYGDDKEFLTPIVKNRLHEMGCRGFLSLEFWDVTPGVKESAMKHDSKKWADMIVFSEYQAKQVVNFVKQIHEQKEDCVLVAHCTAGISRSGAVGAFAVDYAGLKYLDFKEENHQIFPNPHVLRLLRKVSGMNEMFSNILTKTEDGIIIPNLNPF